MAGTLSSGSRGTEVQRLQERLNKRLQPSPGLKEDGVYGPLTEAAVRQYQTVSGIAADGVVGTCTWDALEKRGITSNQTGKNANMLKAACDEAFDYYPHSCSHAACHVIKKYIPSQPYLVANDLIASISRSPKWQEVQIHQLAQLANDGALVVGGATELPHGHVIVVYPGQPKFDGGYHFKSRDGSLILAKPHSVYPRAMSTSMGNWPGARSRGDKTIADPWSREKFKRVKFWKYTGT